MTATTVTTSTDTDPLARQLVATPFGDIAYVDRGAGSVALFVHGVFLNAHLWRHCIDRLAGPDRRCIAVDLLAHGATVVADGQELSIGAQADMLAAVVDALDIEQVDLVGNDSGAAICQVFAARHPDRLRSLALTNGDTHDNWPPENFAPVIEVARQGQLVAAAGALATDPAFARSESGLGSGLEHPEALDDETITAYVGPLFATTEAAERLQAFVASLDHDVTVAIEPQLRALDVPTLIVWGTADTFFAVEWAYWLERTIPGARPVVEVPGGKLFLPEERYELLSDQLRAHWLLAAAS